MGRENCSPPFYLRKLCGVSRESLRTQPCEQRTLIPENTHYQTTVINSKMSSEKFSLGPYVQIKNFQLTNSEDLVPTILKAVVTMILKGNFEGRRDGDYPKP